MADGDAGRRPSRRRAGRSAADAQVRVPARHHLNPSVTAAVPTRDRPELLRRAVRSILDQDYDGDVHCLIVFDGGDPVPVEVPTSQRRSLRTLTNLRTPGLAGARNTGILEADGDLVAFCDDDD